MQRQISFNSPVLCLALALVFPVMAAGQAMARDLTGTEEAGNVSLIAAAPNPEDLVGLPGTSWILISSMADEKTPGRVLAIQDSAAREDGAPFELFPGSLPQARPDLASVVPRFGPHGLNVRTLGLDAYEVLVVDHGDIEAVTLLQLRISPEGEIPELTDVRRIPMPEGVWANGIAALPEGGFLVTSMYDPHDEDFIGKFAKGETTGAIWAWTPEAGWAQWNPLALSGANGIAITADGSAVFVSEWANRRVWRIPQSDAGPPTFVEVAFLPDNLRWTQDGKLLVAGQTANPEEVFACQARPAPCPMGYAVARIDPLTLKVSELARASEADFDTLGFGGATVALEAGQDIWIGSFTHEQIAVLSQAPYGGPGK